MFAPWRCHDDLDAFRRDFSWDATGASGDLLLYHCHWAGELTRHHELSLRSLVATQSPPFEVWLWMAPEDMARNRGFSAPPCVRLREYVAEVEAEGTACAGLAGLLRPARPVDVSNCLRSLVTWRYGGVYFDLDVLFLRDLRPLCRAEFVYQWSDRMYGNSAVMHFRRGSTNGAALLEHGAHVRTFWPRQLLDFGSLAGVVQDLHVLPSIAFDPLWIARDRRQRVNDYCNTFEDFFTAPAAVGLDEFFPGAYAYHWHNQWTTPILPGTLAGRLGDEIDARLRAA